MSKRSIYLLATNTKKPISSIIRMYTREQFNHASITFDKSLIESYSYSMRAKGFVREDLKEWPMWSEFELYELEVTQASYKAIRRFVEHESKAKRSFSYSGIAGIMINRPIQSEEAMFCSEFVENACLAGGLPPSASSPALTTPSQVVKRVDTKLVASGILHQYIVANFSKTQKLITETYTLSELDLF